MVRGNGEGVQIHTKVLDGTSATRGCPCTSRYCETAAQDGRTEDRNKPQFILQSGTMVG